MQIKSADLGTRLFRVLDLSVEEELLRFRFFKCDRLCSRDARLDERLLFLGRFEECFRLVYLKRYVSSKWRKESNSQPDKKSTCVLVCACLESLRT